jgi:hypothetical protein
LFTGAALDVKAGAGSEVEAGVVVWGTGVLEGTTDAAGAAVELTGIELAPLD